MLSEIACEIMLFLCEILSAVYFQPVNLKNLHVNLLGPRSNCSNICVPLSLVYQG